MTDADLPRLSGLARRRRRAVAVAALAAAGLLLTACGQTRLGSAAVVGDQRITDDQVQTLVDKTLSAPGVREGLTTSDYRGDLGAFRRGILAVEVERLLAEDAARRLGITIDDSTVDARLKVIEQQTGGPSQFTAQLAARLAVTPELYRVVVRNDAIKAEIGYGRGGVKRPTEAQLRALYQQALPSATSAELSIIPFRDDASATRALTQVQADPTAFDVLARQAAATGQNVGQPTKYPLNQLPEDLVSRVQLLRDNDTFGYRLVNDNTGATSFLVIRFGGVERPTLESLRPQLEQQSRQQASQAGEKYLAGFARQVGVSVNPRYGTWNPDQFSVTKFDNPVIKKNPTPAPTLPGGDGTGGDGSTGGGTGGAGATPAPTGSPSN